MNLLERTGFYASLHLAVQLVNLSHDLVPVEEGPAFLLLEAVSYTFSNSYQEPQVTRAHLSNFIPEVGERQGRSDLLVGMVPLVDLTWLEQNLLVEHVQATSEVE